MNQRRLADHDAREVVRCALEETLLVEAAAGTGKTSELVRRIVAVLESGRASVESLVAVTFTEKAAGELRLRLRAQLELRRRALQSSSGDSLSSGTSVSGTSASQEAIARIEESLARLEEARLGTIHGFCAELLRERSLEAGIDPEFQVLDEGAAERLFRQAFGSWLEETLEQPPEGVRRSLRRNTAPARPGAGLVRRHADDGPIDRLRRGAWDLCEWRDFGAPWSRPPGFDRSARIGDLFAQIRDFAGLTEQCAQPGRDELYQDTEPIRFLVERVEEAEAVRPRDEDGLEAAFVDLPRNRDLWSRKGRTKLYGSDLPREDVLSARQALLEALQEFQQDADSDLAALLQQELRGAVERYEASKRQAGALDFVDLLLLARDLLVEQRSVRSEYQQRFTHLFVDEFQDTDPLQAEILFLLAADDPAQDDWRRARPRPGALFLVGDPKQSIYRFRRADVGIYQEAKALLEAAGARTVFLTTSFRAVPGLQNLVNAAFTPWIQADRGTLQAAYVPLAPYRAEAKTQPAVVALPVPEPYGARGGVTRTAVDVSLPKATAAFLHWLLHESGWTVTERERPEERIPIGPRHICLLFRRLHEFYSGDVTRPYLDALEGQGIPHLLVGGRSFHVREEVEAIRTTLSAIEWPEDELAVFATLRGSLFAIGDEELLEYRDRYRRLHPYRVPEAEDLPAALRPIADALRLLRSWHEQRNFRPIAETILLLLEETRAHASFALRPSGEQALANVLHVAELARRYESTGGISFRGFLDRLLEEAEEGRAPEAPILEDGSEGVRIMTVHKAKGLEFPVVVLADPSCSLANRQASRFLDPGRGLCAMRLAGWAPRELHAFGRVESGRDQAEGIRLAYVAATRARDLLVVPVLPDGPASFFTIAPGAEGLANTGWTAPIADAVVPERTRWSHPQPAPGAPAFAEDVSFELRGAIRPGLHRIEAETAGGGALPSVEVVWWDKEMLKEGAAPPLGMRREDLIAKDAPEERVREGVARFEAWQSAHERKLAQASPPSARIETATSWARVHEEPVGVEVEIVRVPIDPSRPGGRRFGILVHAILAAAPLDAAESVLREVSRLEARILGATPEEEAAAVRAVGEALLHPLLRRAAEADRRGECRRESPITLQLPDGTSIDGLIDLAFVQDGAWTVVDWKTDRELDLEISVYVRQIGLYARAIATATERVAHAVLMQV